MIILYCELFFPPSLVDDACVSFLIAPVQISTNVMS